MSYDEYNEIDYEEEPRPRDHKIDEVKVVLLADLFVDDPEAVFYQRQVEIRYERRFYHWITAKALNELAEEGRIGSETRQFSNIKIRFYWARTNRYYTRRANAIANLVLRFSAQSFTQGLGRQGEMMFDAALPHGGFMPRAKNVKEFNGRVWTKTDHDLDRVFTLDGIDYGVEIKNTLSYIERKEMITKLEMCEYLGLVPLFIVRMAPASYIEDVRKLGGFTLVVEWQLYPFGQEGFAAEVREELGLKVDCPRAIQAGTIQRLVNWHSKATGKGKK